MASEILAPTTESLYAEMDAKVDTFLITGPDFREGWMRVADYAEHKNVSSIRMGKTVRRMEAAGEVEIREYKGLLYFRDLKWKNGKGD